MNKTTYVPDGQIAQIQAGSRWREVYGALEPYGVTVGGGRTSTVGVAGFLTGGGNTFYTGRRGFACDNVLNYEVGALVTLNTVLGVYGSVTNVRLQIRWCSRVGMSITPCPPPPLTQCIPIIRIR